MRHAFSTIAVLAVLICCGSAGAMPRRATITGGEGGHGKCTIEVSVDGAAEVEISGDTGELRTLSGQRATWRRFQCNRPMPFNPGDFRFIGVDGRGNVQLVRDPRGNRGRAVVRIDDPQSGREGYTFDLEWRGTAGGGWGSEPLPEPPGRQAVARAIQACQDAVITRLNQSGYPSVKFGQTSLDDNPGRRDWITGSATGRQRFRSAPFTFSCSVDFSSGRVRSVDVRGQ